MSRMKRLRGVIESKAHLAPAMTSKTQTHRTICARACASISFLGTSSASKPYFKGEGCLHWGSCCWGPYSWGPAKQPKLSMYMVILCNARTVTDTYGDDGDNDEDDGGDDHGDGYTLRTVLSSQAHQQPLHSDCEGLVVRSLSALGVLTTFLFSV